jgi:hypothetical protein
MDKPRSLYPTREDVLPYVSFAVDDSLNPRELSEIPADARLVGWQCGFEPLFVAVWSYLGVTLTDEEAEEIAMDLLTERGWFDGEPREADFII